MNNEITSDQRNLIEGLKQGKLSWFEFFELWRALPLVLILSLTACNQNGGPAGGKLSTDLGTIVPVSAPSPTPTPTPIPSHIYNFHMESPTGAKRVQIDLSAGRCVAQVLIGLNWACPGSQCVTFYDRQCAGEELLNRTVSLVDFDGDPVDVTLYKDGVPVESTILSHAGESHTFSAGF